MSAKLISTFSAGGATDSSPRRQPVSLVRQKSPAPAGATDKIVRLFSAAPAGA